MGSYHARLIAETTGLELAGVCDTNPERLAAAEHDHAGIRAYSELKALLADSAVDLVALVTPHDEHCPQAVAAAKAGKHVVVDKPMCLSAREGQRMIEAARRAGVMLSVFQNRRWDGDFLTVRKIVEHGTLGPVFQIESSVGGWGAPGGWRRVKKHMGGNLLDWGAHLVDQANILAASPPVRVFAQMQHRVWDVDIETHDKLLVCYESGLVADIEVTCVAWSGKQRWRILGEKGALDKAGFGDDPVRVRTDVATFGAEVLVPPLPGAWQSYYQNVSDHLNKRAELAVKPEGPLLAMRVMDAAFASAQSGKMVSLVKE
jgi:predicted dehydrogenase